MSHLGFMLLLRLEYADANDSSPGMREADVLAPVLVGAMMYDLKPRYCRDTIAPYEFEL
jgi:hypothetical protein